MNPCEFIVGDFVVIAVPVLRDNLAYLVCRGGQAVLVDAGEAGPLLRELERRKLRLVELLVTHTHPDHVGGAREIHEKTGVLARSPGLDVGEIPMLGTVCRSISTPGHMAVHKCFYFPELAVLFTGDTLINGASGRLLGGTMEQHFESFRRLAAFPGQTRVFGGHDYLADNLAFAQAVEPDNSAVPARLALYRRDPAAALFATLDDEKKTNPFLRAPTLEAFADLRHRKDAF